MILKQKYDGDSEAESDRDSGAEPEGDSDAESGGDPDVKPDWDSDAELDGDCEGMILTDGFLMGTLTRNMSGILDVDYDPPAT
ncbi:MAG: hypothetical protein BJ554DRAFT_4483 [Olpidium bornovanus]|uniref:Uncharacterized protein n=1 Tax=Olpidium bornovanus TaxID=278681 RepID=A0A8H7ZN03_9FUNG|nr:MAG: hypothetical protein BJ554DRAFT_4483 [Olpidium bornovanus]